MNNQLKIMANHSKINKHHSNILKIVQLNSAQKQHKSFEPRQNRTTQFCTPSAQHHIRITKIVLNIANVTGYTPTPRTKSRTKCCQHRTKCCQHRANSYTSYEISQPTPNPKNLEKDYSGLSRRTTLYYILWVGVGVWGAISRLLRSGRADVGVRFLTV